MTGATSVERQAAFSAGTVVVVSLANPREKFWGAVLELSVAGLSLRGIDLVSFDDYLAQLRAGEPVTVSEVFFPMHRVERVEADLPSGIIPALAQRFEDATGVPASEWLGKNSSRSVPER